MRRMNLTGLVAALFVAVALTTAAWAAVPTDGWTGAGGDNSWSTTANWSTGAQPLSGEIAVFTIVAPRPNPVVNVDAAVGGLQFSAGTNTTQIQDGGGYTLAIGPSSVSVANGLTIDINSRIALATPQTWMCTGDLNVASDIIKAGFEDWTLVKTGSGTLTLRGNNTFGGGVTLVAGTLNVNSASALGTGRFVIVSGTIDNTSAGAVTLSTNNAQMWDGDFTFTGT